MLHVATGHPFDDALLLRGYRIDEKRLGHLVLALRRGSDDRRGSDPETADHAPGLAPSVRTRKKHNASDMASQAYFMRAYTSRIAEPKMIYAG